MKKRITVDYQYAAINFNAKLETLVNSLVEADIQDKLPRTLETQYDRRYVESAECEQRANRALEILGERYPTNQFAAHSDATAFPPNSYWRILATTTTGRPLSKQKMVKVRAAAKRIVKNISAKYPELAKQHRKAIEKKESRTKFWGAIKNLLAP